MRPLLFCVGVALTVGGLSSLTAEQGPEKPRESAKSPAKSPAAAKPAEPETPPQPAPEDVEFLYPQPEAKAGTHLAAEKLAVQDLIKAFVKSFNAHDPQSLGPLFAAEAEMVDSTGKVVQGREAIEKAFARLFKSHRGLHMQARVESIRFVSRTTAIEEGTTLTVGESDAGPAVDVSRYVVTHILQDGKWQMASVRDLPLPEVTAEQALEQLSWLVGDWYDENGATLTATSYRWSDDKQFLLSEFTIQLGNQPPVKGTQRIGWDPRSNQLRSWTFDSAGGFGEALWSRDGNRWIAKTTGVTRGGQVTSATNILTQVSKDMATFQSRDRVAGGVSAPDIGEIPIVRRPPPPKSN